jgi:methyl-accepting chemotaxis protein
LRRVINPMVTLAIVTTQLADGESPEIPSRERTDALGLLANALDSFRVAAQDRREADARNMQEQQCVNDALGDRLEALRLGDLTRTIATPFPAAYERLRTNFNEAVSALRGMVQMVSESASNIDSGAQEIASAADDLARRTEASAANLEETNAALQQVEARVRDGREATQVTMVRADQTIRIVGEGRATGADAAASMDRVAASAENIGSVIDGLDKIAFQTRVLAMNAAVEAGRAGAAGSGFAVVADLVSALAQRAEEESKRVRVLITSTRDDIETAADAVRRTDRSLETIAEDVEALHQLLVRLEGDSAAQARAMTEIAGAMAQLDRSTQQNAAMVEQTSAGARSLSGEVSLLAERAGAFKFERRERDVPVEFDRRGSRRSGDSAGAGRRAADNAAIGRRTGDSPRVGASIH